MSPKGATPSIARQAVSRMASPNAHPLLRRQIIGVGRLSTKSGIPGVDVAGRADHAKGAGRVGVAHHLLLRDDPDRRRRALLPTRCAELQAVRLRRRPDRPLPTGLTARLALAAASDKIAVGRAREIRGVSGQAHGRAGLGRRADPRAHADRGPYLLHDAHGLHPRGRRSVRRRLLSCRPVSTTLTA